MALAQEAAPAAAGLASCGRLKRKTLVTTQMQASRQLSSVPASMMRALTALNGGGEGDSSSSSCDSGSHAIFDTTPPTPPSLHSSRVHPQDAPPPQSPIGSEDGRTRQQQRIQSIIQQKVETPRASLFTRVLLHTKVTHIVRFRCSNLCPLRLPPFLVMI